MMVAERTALSEDGTPIRTRRAGRWKSDLGLPEACGPRFSAGDPGREAEHLDRRSDALQRIRADALERRAVTQHGHEG